MDMIGGLDLGGIFPVKLETDDRTYVFRVPLVKGDYGFYSPSIAFWVQALTLISLQALLIAAMSVVVKKYIINHRGKPISYLVGYGVLIPLIIAFPHYCLAMLDIRNKMLKFLAGGIVPTLAIFRCLEAIHGCEPRHVTKSRGTYALYFGSIMELCYDPKEEKFVKSSMSDVMANLMSFLTNLFVLGAFQSLVAPFDLQPFRSLHGKAEWYALARVFDLAQLGNNFVYAVTFQLYLTCFLEGFGAFTALILGYKTKPGMMNPVFTSTSPSQFWGRNWNTVVHGALKRGVFKPVISATSSKVLAVFATFLASGLLHEWILTTAYLPLAHELQMDGSCGPPNCFIPSLGGSTAFFLWSAMMISLETLIGHWAIFQWMKRTMPSSIRTIMVVLLALPVAHWFLDPYARSDFFTDDAQVALPMILPILPSI